MRLPLLIILVIITILPIYSQENTSKVYYAESKYQDSNLMLGDDILISYHKDNSDGLTKKETFSFKNNVSGIAAISLVKKELYNQMISLAIENHSRVIIVEIEKFTTSGMLLIKGSIWK